MQNIKQSIITVESLTGKLVISLDSFNLRRQNPYCWVEIRPRFMLKNVIGAFFYPEQGEYSLIRTESGTRRKYNNCVSLYLYPIRVIIRRYIKKYILIIR